MDFLLGAGEAQRKPFLPLAAKLRQPVRWRTRIGRKLVTQPIGLAEIVGAFHAGLFPKLAHDRGARIFLPVDSALRHLPLKAGENDLRAVVPESPSDQNLAGGIEQRNADIGTVRFFFGHSGLRRSGHAYSRWLRMSS